MERDTQLKEGTDSPMHNHTSFSGQPERSPTRRRFVAGTLTALAGLALSACGSPSPVTAVASTASSTASAPATSASTQEATSSAIVLTSVSASATSASATAAAVPSASSSGVSGGAQATVWVYDAFSSYKEMLQKLDTLVYEPFKTQHPTVTVKHDSVTSGDFYNKVPVLFAGGTAPDLLWIQTFAHYTYIDQGLVLALDPLVARDKAFDLQDFWPKGLSSLQKDGKLYGLPYNMQVVVVYYNKDLFQKAGVEFPKPGWTWNDFADTAKRLTSAQGDNKIFGALPLGAGSWQLESILLQSGGSILNQDRTAPNVTSAGSLEALQWLTDLYVKDRVAPNKGNPTGKGQGFQTGNGGMLQADLTARETLNNQKVAINYDVAPLPKGSANNLSITGGGAYWISQPSRVADPAFQLMTALLSKESAPAYGTTGIPGRQSASDVIKVPGQPPASIQVYLDAMKDAPGPTWSQSSQNRKIWQAYGAPLQKAFDGETTVRDAATGAQQAIAAVLAEKQ
jgi:multiple sugar transport system substrate-binding protein